MSKNKRNFYTTEHPMLLQDDGCTEHVCSTCKFFDNASFCAKYSSDINEDTRIQKAYTDNDCIFYEHYANK